MEQEGWGMGGQREEEVQGETVNTKSLWKRAVEFCFD